MTRPSLDDFFSRPHHQASPAVVKPVVMNGSMHGNTVTLSKGKDLSNADNETLSTFNCDDSFSASSFQSAPQQKQMPPVNTVRVVPTAAATTPAASIPARQKLRDQEQKISALIRNDTSLLTIVKTLEEDLKKTEAEKEQLEEALLELEKQRLEQQKEKQDEEEEVDDDTSEEDEDELSDDESSSEDPNSSTALLQRVLVEQRDAWHHAQAALQEKTKLMTQLRSRLDAALKQIASLQVALETHDVHFTSYAKQSIAQGKAAMAELKVMTGKEKAKETRDLGKRAKEMIRTLLQDLNALDQRYKDEKHAHLKHQADWDEQRGILQQRIRQLQQQRRQHASLRSMSGSSPNSKISPVLPVIAEEDDTLLEQTQAELAHCQTQLDQQHAHLEAMQTEVSMQKAQAQQMRQEKRTAETNMEGLHQRIYALEIKSQQQKLLLELQASTDYNQRHKGLFGKLTKRKRKNKQQKDSTTDEEKLRLLYERMNEQDARMEELQTRNELQARQNAQLKQQLQAQQDADETARASQQLNEQRIVQLQSQVQQLKAQLARVPTCQQMERS